MERQFAGGALSRLNGQRHDLLIPTPAAGTDWTYAIPGGFAIRLLLATWTLKASAQIAKRYPSFVVRDGDGNIRLQTTDTGEIIAAAVARVTAAQGVTTAASASGLAFTIQAPSTIIDPGWSIGSLTTNLASEDQIEGVRLLVEELIERNPGEGYGVTATPTLEIDLEMPHA
jgi:hypothetical protein